MAMDLLNKKKKSLLKQVATDNLYQSTFLPIFDDAQKRIKELIITFYWLGLPITTLRQKIKAIIISVKGKIPKDLHDREAYINGLIKNTNELLNIYFVRATAYFKKAKEIYENTLDPNIVSTKLANMKIKSPKDLAEAIKLAPKHQKDIWASQKGAVRLPQYDKKIKEYINKISDLEITTSEKGKKSISLWQKAELDVRHEKQIKMLDDLKNDGVDLCWISTHPDCSKRCEKWQGKLVSLTLPSTMTGFRVKKVDGNWVYSLTDIMAQKDKYGYENNIINGFNCFDKETEVLTNNGWKLFAELNEDDLIYTLNRETRISEWQKPINYFKKLYNGKMIRAKSYISDLLITPNHNMLYYQQHNTSLRFKEAKDLNIITNIQYAGQEWVGNNEKYITIGKTKVESKIFCRLLGYYLADGSSHDKNSIKIAQQNNDEMWESLKELPYKLWRDDNKIIVRDKELHDLFRQLGTCETKYVFSWVKELSKECLNEFLKAFNYTDGYTNKSKTINGYVRKPHKVLFTTSKQLCADLCEIALKCGYRPKIELRKNKNKEHKFKNGTYKLNYDLYVIHLNYSTSFRYKTLTEEDYCDYVYCVEVPNHTLLVKRNGFIQWCGNCRHHLTPYTPNSNAPTEYTAEEIKKQRAIETNIRAMEREIRHLKTKLKGYTIISEIDKSNARTLKALIKSKIAAYKKYCNDNGYAWYEYRIGYDTL